MVVVSDISCRMVGLVVVERDPEDTTGRSEIAIDSAATVVSTDGAASLDGSSATLHVDAALIGTRLLHFRIVACLGKGGMGIVYKAVDEKLRRPIALKVLSSGPFADDTRRAMLLREARSAAGLSHPGIAAVYDIHETRGIAYIAMELVEGETLRAHLGRGAIAMPDLARWAIEIASGLGSAHRSRIVHRDLKPDNVMVTPDGHAKILDFGLAKPLTALADAVASDDEVPSSGFATRAGSVMGTPRYMSPEQARGESVDERSDVFSLGAMLYEMATGTAPFAERVRQRDPRTWGGEGSSDWARRDLLHASPRTPPSFARVIERCLSFSPEQRFNNGAELADSLGAVADELGLLRGGRMRPSPSSQRMSSRRRMAWTFGGAALLVAVVVGAIALRTRSSHQIAASSPAPPSSVPPSDFAITSAPTELTSIGDCARAPVFDDDGSLVFGVHDGERAGIYRLDPGGEPRPIVDGVGRFMNPAPGGPGRVVFMHQPQANGASEVQSVASDGGPVRTEIPVEGGAGPAWVAGGFLFTLRHDNRAIRRRTLDGSTDEVLYESPSGSGYADLAASPDGRFVAVNMMGSSRTDATPVCVGEGAPGKELDCEAAGISTAGRPAFSAGGRALYFTRGDDLVRFDLATHATTSHPLVPRASTLAISPDGARLVMSSCQIVYDVVRLDDSFAASPLAGAAKCAGTIAVSPRGALAFPIEKGVRTSLAVTDDDGLQTRVVTGSDRTVTEAAYSPDGSRLVFHDANEDTGGLFVIDVTADRGATRLTAGAGDGSPSWLDADRVVFLRPEKGLPYGRAYVVSTSGGEPHKLPILPGIPFGAVPSRGVLLMIILRGDGARFVECTLEGKTRAIVLDGAPSGIAPTSVAASPSGRFITWVAAGIAWRADLQTKKATRIAYTPPRLETAGVMADDLGRITFAARRLAGQLYDVRGSFP